MSQPFTRIPEPEIPRPFKRRLQPSSVPEIVRSGWREARRRGEGLMRRTEELWRRGKRQPKAIGMVAGAAALTLLGGYTLSASGVGRSMCASALEASSTKSKANFLLLVDPVPATRVGSELELHYNVCGLPSGASYKGRLEIAQQRVAKKGAAKPKPVVVTFKDRADGIETRRHREVGLGRLKPGLYTLQLSVTDSRGRERKTIQKVKLNAR